MNLTYRIKAITKSAAFWSIVLFGLVIWAISFGVQDVSKTVAEQQTLVLENAVRRIAVQCYALEGSYPTSLVYMADNYGLYYDAEDYVIHYNNLGSNLLPEVSVFYIGGDGEQ